MVVSVSLVRILPGEHLSLFGKADGTSEGSWWQGAQEPVGRAGPSSDCAPSSVEALDGGASFLADGCDPFESAVDSPLTGENSGILVTVGVADHGGLN